MYDTGKQRGILEAGTQHIMNLLVSVEDITMHLSTILLD